MLRTKGFMGGQTDCVLRWDVSMKKIQDPGNRKSGIWVPQARSSGREPTILVQGLHSRLTLMCRNRKSYRNENTVSKLKQNDRYVIPSLDRAFVILGLLAEEPKGLSLAELARRTEIPKSTLFRILVTLQKHHCVAADTTGRTFRLGSYLWELGSRFADQSDLFRVSASYMADLADEVEETVFLSKLEDGEVVYLRRVESPKSIAAVRKLESRAPVHCTATGLALVAWLPPREIDDVLAKDEMQSFNDATVTDRSIIRERMAEVRDREYAVVDGEYNDELLCVSAPVLDHQRRPSAALTVTMLSSQVKNDSAKIERVGQAVRRAARSLSREMGGGEPIRLATADAA